MFALNANPRVEALYLADTGTVPNSRLPVVVYKAAFSPQAPSSSDVDQGLTQLAWRNGWKVDWVESDAVFRYTHYHTTAHEVLAVLDEVAAIRLGGEGSKTVVHVSPGDLLGIPAGVAHRRISGNQYFRVAGLYLAGAKWDLMRVTPANYRKAQHNLPNVELPEADPLYGQDGPLMQYWK